MIRRRFSYDVLAGSAACWLLLALAALPFGPIGCSSQPAAPPPGTQSTQTAPPAPLVPPAPAIPTAERPPSALMEVGDAAESLFNAANSKDWRAAAGQLEALQASAADLPGDLRKPDLVVQLRSRVDNLGQTVRAHQRIETMDDANGITRLVAELATKYQTRIPYEVILLDYYGRQLELGIAGARLPLLKQTTADLRSTWNMIERTI